MQTPLIKNSRPDVPAKIRKLLIRASILFLSWCILYYGLLQPLGVPDQQLTEVVLNGTVALLSAFYTDVLQVGNSIFLQGVRSVNVAPQCNGLELMVLYLGVLIIMPTTIRRMLTFSVAGVVVITMLNIIRCALLAVLYLHDVDLADVAHHYVFKLIIYGVVFYGWMLYTRTVTPDEAKT